MNRVVLAILLLTLPSVPVSTYTYGCAQKQVAAANTPADLWTGFQNVPPSSRMRMYWRVFGPAWEPREIRYQLELLRQAHVGGITTYFMYPTGLDSEALGIHNQSFLSQSFLKTFGIAARAAHRLGLRFSVSGGTGWPYGGPMVTPDIAARHLHMVKVTPKNGAITVPALKLTDRIVAAFCGVADITNAVSGARLTGDSVPAAAPVLLFVDSLSGMKVKRAALGGEGLVLDHYSRTAALAYLAGAALPELQQCAPGTLESLFCDSLEVYNANWTLNMPAEFINRRGYDLIPHLPDLFDARSPNCADLRYDFWRTLAELTESQFTATVSDWCHSHGLKLEMEAYGTPSNPLTAARYIDVPTGEQYEWQGFSFSRFAASGAHLAGKQIVGTEAWTWAGLPNRLGDTLSDLKLLSNFHFLAGMNDLTGVDFAYSPRAIGSPGWLPYYGPAFNQNNPQWPYFSYFADYINRCQFMLRQGRSVADIAVVIPEEQAFAHAGTNQLSLDFVTRDHFVTGHATTEFGLKKALLHHSDLLHTIITRGFNFDGIDMYAINRLAKPTSGLLVAGDGRYRIVVLPHLEGMDYAALKRLVEFCRLGGTLIATNTLPLRCWGAGNDGAALTPLLSKLVHSTFGPNAGGTVATANRVGKGTAIYLPDERGSLGAALSNLHPDAATRGEQDVGFVHRVSASHDIYYMVNVTDNQLHCKTVFNPAHGLQRHSVFLCNPANGTVKQLRATDESNGLVQLQYTLAPRGSLFVVFGKGPSQPVTPGRPPLMHSVALVAPWTIRFNGADAPGVQTLSRPVYWSSLKEAAGFSGTGIYSCTLLWNHWPPVHCEIQIPPAQAVAAVYVNGKCAGGLFAPPWTLPIDRQLRKGINRIEIHVGNTLVNRFIAVPTADLIELRKVYGERFPDPEEKALVKTPPDSGIQGTVLIRY